MMEQKDILNEINKLEKLRAFYSNKGDINGIIRVNLAISLLKNDLINLLLKKAA